MKSTSQIEMKYSPNRITGPAVVGLTVLCALLLFGVAGHSRAGEKKALETATFALG